MKSCVILLLLALCATLANAQGPLWKVFCDADPIYRGRIDPIVNPGKLSGHSHKVFGASNFNPGSTNRTAQEEQDILMASPCTTCSINVDKSAYWIPDLYYQWPNKTFSVVPHGGLTVYYPSRSGSGEQANPKWKAFPHGLRILAGNPFRRSFNQSSVADDAINYACLSKVLGPETNGFPADITQCINGFRAQVWFPMCWDGVNLDSPDHKSHMAYPTRKDSGNCPASHPVRVPGIFYEVLFSITDFPPQSSYQPFVWANGDPTGYGLHGDFLNGWDEKILQRAIEDVTCYSNNTNNGNRVESCNALAPYLRQGNDQCLLSNPIYITEDLAMNHAISALPGCNPVTLGPEDAKPCTTLGPQPSSGPGWTRFLLKPKNSTEYVSAKSSDVPLTASVTKPSYSEIWTIVAIPEGHTFQSDLTGSYVTAPHESEMKANRRDHSEWEHFIFKDEGDGYFSIMAHSNDKYVTLYPDGTLHANSTTVGDLQLFKLIDPATLGETNLVDPIVISTPYVGDDDEKDDNSTATGVFPTWQIVCVSLAISWFSFRQ